MNPIVALLALGLGNPPVPPLAPPPAPLHCPAPVAAKGDTRGGPPLIHTFELTNREMGTLTITNVETGCGCVRRTLSKTALKPGETTKLTLEINTLTQPDGPIRWPAIVRYSVDAPVPMPGALLLAVSAKLSREVTVNPPQLAFSTTGEAAQIVAVVDRRAKALTVVKAVGSAPHLTATIAPRKLEPGGMQSQQITLKLAANAPAGQRDEMLILQTDDPEYPEFRVPVRVLKRAAGAVSAVPEAIAVRFAAGQDEVSTLVQLRADGKPIRIAEVQSDSPAIAVKFSREAAAVAVLRITVAGTPQPGSGRVKIRLAEPAGHEVIVPVTWAGRKNE